MVRRAEITDRAWQEIEPLLPNYGQSGGQWRDHRTVINGILWKLRTGSPWRDLPERYGSWQTCFDPVSTAGEGTVLGIASWPMRSPSRTRSER